MRARVEKRSVLGWNKSVRLNIFLMTVTVETNYHIAYDEIYRIFDGNAVHCIEVKNSTSDDSEQLKE